MKKHTRELWWACSLVVAFASSGMADENADAAKAKWCSELARVKREQAQAQAEVAKLSMPLIFNDYLTAAEHGRVADADELYAQIRRGTYQYADSTNPVPELQTALWQYVLEFNGAVGLFRQSESLDLLRDYAQAVFNDMPTNSVYF